jgi:hypothetical protein
MSNAVTGFGLTAAAIAVGGFLAHVRPALAGDDEQRLREATVIGGLGGIAVAVTVMVLSALFS